MNNTSSASPLFERITTCANAIRFLKDEKGNKEYEPSCIEVEKLLPQIKATEHRNTNLTKCSLEYLKLGFVDRKTKSRKANIAMWVAVSIADDQDDMPLAKAVCERFRDIDDFDRKVMEKIFNFSVCNDRVLALLDDAMILKETSIHQKIEHEFRFEFIFLFFNVMESLVRRGHTLADLGYEAHVSSTDMERAREIIDEHMDTIATKCWPCFKTEALKKPRRQNILFPAKGALPRVSIGCEHVDFDEATIGTLTQSLLDKEEKGEFLELIFAAISHSSNDPSVTYRALKLESVKTFFLDEMLDEAQKEETLNQVSAPGEVCDLRKENESLKEKLSSVEAELSSAKEELSSAKEANSCMYDKYMAVQKLYSSEFGENEELRKYKKRFLLAEEALQSKEEYCEKFHVKKKSKKRGRLDMFSVMPCHSGVEEYSGDEDE